MLVLLLIALSTTIGNVESKYIDEALKVLNVTPSDLEYKKIWVKQDPFRLKLVEKFMNHPLSMPYTADTIEDSIKTLKSEPGNLSSYLSSLIDVETYDYPEENLKISLPDTLNLGIKKLIKSLYLASLLSQKTFDKLSRGEIDTLLSDAIYWWTDEDDSTDDTLRGVILREFGETTPFAYGDTTSIPLDSLSMLLEKVDLRYMNSAFRDVLKAIEDFVKNAPIVKDSFQYEFDSPIGMVAIGGVGKNVYRGDFALIVDFGGNDEYYGRVGAGIIWQPVGVVIDLGGDDVYRSDKTVSLGAGYLGIGVIYDAKGNDFYYTSHVSLGAGLVGCGALIDLSGNDTYRAGFFSEGSGNFGIGIMEDLSGDDDYQAVDWAQGFGSVKGIGLLFDDAGDDRYYAGGYYIHHPLLPHNYRSFAQGFAMGWRPDISGGIGILIDSEGNDSYYVEVYGQGASYWLSAGFLIDDAGDDTYHGVEYVQGAGIHLSTGILVDRGGDDSYYSRYGPSQGEGHDLSVGWLVDKAGDDNYYVSGGQGAGIYNSVGFFIDSGGDDTYMTREKNAGQGWANWGRKSASIGIFLDLGGKDIYRKGLAGRDNKIWLDGTFGVGIDTEAVK